uniref:Genome polyprotein n=1 Tax=Picornavirales sp. TaxID=1955153 RepID=A0A6M9Z7C5_9VIRU|nr:MAG: polyprotein [Picornavirales sp.]
MVMADQNKEPYANGPGENSDHLPAQRSVSGPVAPLLDIVNKNKAPSKKYSRKKMTEEVNTRTWYNCRCDSYLINRYSPADSSSDLDESEDEAETSHVVTCGQSAFTSSYACSQSEHALDASIAYLHFNPYNVHLLARAITSPDITERDIEEFMQFDLALFGEIPVPTAAQGPFYRGTRNTLKALRTIVAHILGGYNERFKYINFKKNDVDPKAVANDIVKGMSDAFDKKGISAESLIDPSSMQTCLKKCYRNIAWFYYFVSSLADTVEDPFFLAGYADALNKMYPSKKDGRKTYGSGGMSKNYISKYCRLLLINLVLFMKSEAFKSFGKLKRPPKKQRIKSGTNITSSKSDVPAEQTAQSQVENTQPPSSELHSDDGSSTDLCQDLGPVSGNSENVSFADTCTTPSDHDEASVHTSAASTSSDDSSSDDTAAEDLSSEPVALSTEKSSTEEISSSVSNPSSPPLVPVSELNSLESSDPIEGRVCHSSEDSKVLDPPTPKSSDTFVTLDSSPNLTYLYDQYYVFKKGTVPHNPYVDINKNIEMYTFINTFYLGHGENSINNLSDVNRSMLFSEVFRTAVTSPSEKAVNDLFKVVSTFIYDIYNTDEMTDGFMALLNIIPSKYLENEILHDAKRYLLTGEYTLAETHEFLYYLACLRLAAVVNINPLLILNSIDFLDFFTPIAQEACLIVLLAIVDLTRLIIDPTVDGNRTLLVNYENTLLNDLRAAYHRGEDLAKTPLYLELLSQLNESRLQYCLNWSDRVLQELEADKDDSDIKKVLADETTTIEATELKKKAEEEVSEEADPAYESSLARMGKLLKKWITSPFQKFGGLLSAAFNWIFDKTSNFFKNIKESLINFFDNYVLKYVGSSFAGIKTFLVSMFTSVYDTFVSLKKTVTTLVIKIFAAVLLGYCLIKLLGYLTDPGTVVKVVLDPPPNVDVTYVAQSDGFSAPFKLFACTLLAITGLSRPVIIFCKLLSAFDSFKPASSDVLSLFESAIPASVLTFLTGKGTDPEFVVLGQIYDDLVKVRDITSIRTCESYSKTLNAFVDRCRDYMAHHVGSKEFTHVMAMHREALSLIGDNNALSVQFPRRMRPVLIHLIGPSGVGKTYSAVHMARRLGYKDHQIGNIPGHKDDFWICNSNHRVLIYDEAYCHDESAGKLALYLLGLVNTTPFYNPGSDITGTVSNKKTLLYPDIVFMISQKEVYGPTDLASQKNREDFSVRVEANAQFCAEHGLQLNQKNDLDKLSPEERNSLAWIDFYRYDPILGSNDPTGYSKYADFNQFLMDVAGMVNARRNAFMSSLSEEEKLRILNPNVYFQHMVMQSLSTLPYLTTDLNSFVDGIVDTCREKVVLPDGAIDIPFNAQADEKAPPKNVKKEPSKDPKKSFKPISESSDLKNNSLPVIKRKVLAVEPVDVAQLANVPIIKRTSYVKSKGFECKVPTLSQIVQPSWQKFGIIAPILASLILVVGYTLASYFKKNYRRVDDNVQVANGSYQKWQQSGNPKRKHKKGRGYDSDNDSYGWSPFMEHSAPGELVLNYCTIRFVVDDFEVKARSLYLGNNIFLTYHHAVAHNKELDSNVTITYRDSLVYSGSDYRLLHYQHKDLLALKVNGPLHMTPRSCLKHIIAIDPDLFSSTVSNHHYAYVREDDRPLNWTSGVFIPTRKYTVSFLTSGSYQIYSCDSLIETPIASTYGDCGTALIDDSNHIVGIHVCGTDNRSRISHSGAVTITQAEIIELLDAFNTTFSSQRPMYFLPRTSKLEPTTAEPLALDNGIRMYPPTMSKHQDPQGRDPVVEYIDRIKKFENHSPVDEVLVKRCAYEIAGNFSEAFPNELSPLSLYQAVTGIDHLSAVDLTTSCGYPLCLTYPDGKRSLIDIDHDHEQINLAADLVAEYSKAEAYICHGDNYECVFLGFFKDEPISEKKFLECRTRVIFCGPLGLNLYMRTRVGALLACFHNYTRNCNMALGFNPASSDANFLVDHLCLPRLNHRMIDLDSSAFDLTIHRSFLLAAYNVIKDLVVTRHLMTEQEFDRYIDLVVNPHIVLGDYDCYPYSINPSGNLFTTIINSIVNEMYLRYMFYKVNPNKIFDDYIHAIVYGDDAILSVELDARLDFFMLKRLGAEMGLKLTNGSKDQEEKDFLTFEETSFLSHKYRQTEFGWMGYLKKKNLLCSLAYSKKGVIPPEAIESLMRETCAMPDDEFLAIWTEISNYLPSVKVDPLLPRKLRSFQVTAASAFDSFYHGHSEFTKFDENAPNIEAIVPSIGRGDNLSDASLSLTDGPNSWFQVDSFEWTTSQGAGQEIYTLKVPKIFGANNMQSLPFYTSVYSNFNVCVRFTLNGSRFSQGLLVCYFEPFGKQTAPQSLSMYDCLSVNHILLTPQNSDDVEITIPFSYFRRSFYNENLLSGGTFMGWLHVMVLSKYVVGEGDDTICSVTVFERFDNPSFVLPRNFMVAQGMWSKVLKTSEKAIGQLRSCAEELNLDAPDVVGVPEVVSLSYPSLSYDQLQRPTNELKLTPGEFDGIGRSILPAADMSIENLLSRDWLLDSFDWHGYDATNFVLKTYPLNSTMGFEPNAQVTIPSGIALLNTAIFYRCTFHFRFIVVKSAFQTGRLRFSIVYGPNSYSGDNLNTYKNFVANFDAETNEFELDVGFNASNDFLMTYAGSLDALEYLNYNMGTLVVSVLNPLKNIETSASTVNILTYVSFRDAQLFVPRPMRFWRFVDDEPVNLVAQSEVQDREDVDDQYEESDDLCDLSGVEDKYEHLQFSDTVCLFTDLVRRGRKFNLLDFGLNSADILNVESVRYNNLDASVYNITVKPRFGWEKFFRCWSGSLHYRIYNHSPTSIFTRVMFIPACLHRDTTKVSLASLFGARCVSDNVVVGPLSYSYPPQELAFRYCEVNEYIDVSIPFQTIYNYLEIINYQTEPLGIISILSSGDIEIFQYAGDDFVYGYWYPQEVSMNLFNPSGSVGLEMVNGYFFN